MKRIKWNYFFVLLVFLVACKQHKESPGNNTDIVLKKNETIKIMAQQRPFGEPVEFEMEVKRVIDKLEFANPNDVQMDSTDLIIGMTMDETKIAIPLKYLSAFEVANFSKGADSYTVTWCPIVGTARIFESGKVDSNAGFDIGWGLNKNNLLLVDRQTQSVWNQLSGEAIHGERKGEILKSNASIQCTWGYWNQTHPQTKLLINKDTVNSIFPESIQESPHYNNWQPGDGRPEMRETHSFETLGLGIEGEGSAMFFPFETLFKENAPLLYDIEDQEIVIYFDKSGLTAWAENSDGKRLPSIVVYDWAWKGFFPNTKIYER